MSALTGCTRLVVCVCDQAWMTVWAESPTEGLQDADECIQEDKDANLWQLRRACSMHRVYVIPLCRMNVVHFLDKDFM